MNRKELAQYIMDQYNAELDRPWAKYPNHEVLRHCNNRKWFALIMDVPKEKLGLKEKGTLDIVNLKCGPLLVAPLCAEKGIFPAYHMSKTSWLSAALDGSVDEEKIKWLLDMSFDATAAKTRARWAGVDK